MTTWSINGGRTLSGVVVTPPDKSISHRALILAALGEGKCSISPLSSGVDNRTTLAVLRQMGVSIEVDESRGIAIVEGVGGPSGLTVPDAPVDCGNSGTTIRLMAGVASAMDGQTLTLTGDESLCGRPMSRLLPLTEMGAQLDGVERDGKIYPPITIRGARLRGMRHDLKVASAQVKTAIALAGLWADGETLIVEPGRSRDHTERMLRALGADINAREDGAIVVRPLARPWSCEHFAVAPDISSAAFLLGAAVVTKSEELVVETAVNPTRSGILDVLEAFGVQLHREVLPDRGGEPMARLSVRVNELKGTVVSGTLTLRAIDEIPLIAALAAFVPGTTHIQDAGELRVKESDRIATTVKMLRAFGVVVDEQEEGMVIQGAPSNLKGAEIDAGHDHRIGMTATVMGLGIFGTTCVKGAEIVDVSYPGFAGVINSLGGRVELG